MQTMIEESEATGAAGIRLEGLVKSFATPTGPVRAVRGVDLSVEPGETVALLGPNGAGKSTLIDMLLGLLPPDAGRVSLFGRAPDQAIRDGAVGAMLQIGGLIKQLSVRELVSMMAALYVIVSIGAMMIAFARKIAANRELHAAREELAELAVSEERLRIARDLHDLLGHSLSVIALKSELASRLVEHDPARAAKEMDEIQTVTRGALAEVREAVQGYRRQGLADALERARTALRAAGIECELDGPPAELPPDVESVLAWAVREGATNVVRHSGAQHCSIRVRAERAQAAVEVEDNGQADGAYALAGSGLTGLAERAQGVDGTLEAGARPGGGFRLRLTVPLPAT
jgi:signal transduction histidine kinase